MCMPVCVCVCAGVCRCIKQQIIHINSHNSQPPNLNHPHQQTTRSHPTSINHINSHNSQPPNFNQPHQLWQLPATQPQSTTSAATTPSHPTSINHINSHNSHPPNLNQLHQQPQLPATKPQSTTSTATTPSHPTWINHVTATTPIHPIWIVHIKSHNSQPSNLNHSHQETHLIPGSQDGCSFLTYLAASVSRICHKPTITSKPRAIF